MRDHPPPCRIRLFRTKGSRMPANAVKVDRSAFWGNPWMPPGILVAKREGKRIDYLLPIAETGDGIDAAEAVSLYRLWLTRGIIIPGPVWPSPLTEEEDRGLRDHLTGKRGLILANIHELKGRDLACWCAAGCPCHADVLLELANG